MQFVIVIISIARCQSDISATLELVSEEQLKEALFG